MNSPLADGERAALIEAMLPAVPFDGWSRPALRAAVRRIGLSSAEALALFPGGAADLVAAFSRWADRRMLDRLEGAALDELGTTARIRLALRTRFDVLTSAREAVRRALAELALPQNAVLGCRLLYETVDAIWYAAGDASTDFSFYTKRMTLAGLLAAATVYWLDDRSPEAADTEAFIDRRLEDLHRFGAARARFDELLARLPNPFRMLHPMR